MKGFCMSGLLVRLGSVLTIAALGLALTGCGSTAINRAPVEDRGADVVRVTPTAVEPVAPAPKQPQGFENAGKTGYYSVKPGDTLLRIALDHGQSAKDIARWSSVENPNRIEVGQVLRITPPVATSAPTAAVSKPVPSPSVAPVAGNAAKPLPGASASAPAGAPTASPAAAADDDLNWIWPAKGAVLAGFDEAKNKGLDIGGAAGDAVLAAADGRVVYVGAGLRGYGNLIILKHNNTYLTAYAHNQTLLIKEDQSVRQGQKIAEMGSSDSDRVKLHFEVRRQGKPVDPAKYLPAR
jgi:lipoprotein NlpD